MFLYRAIDLEKNISNRIEKLDLPGVRKIIAVASGKGGVGKSTISANIALALASKGLNVGLLDADIYGPSQSHIMGVKDMKPELSDKCVMPIVAHDVKCMSMGFVMSPNTPAIWRGPMASGALQRLLSDTKWGNLDILLVDMPPGTGDIQLTISQRVPLGGAIIVTTPQDIALLDARKAIEMFTKVGVPALGIVENMSTHVCSHCGHEEAVFGSNGGERIALEYGTKLLAQLPLSLSIRKQSDEGVPIVLSDPESPASQAIHLASEELIRDLSALVSSGPEIDIIDD